MSLLFLVVMIMIVVVAVLEVHEINQEQGSKEGSFYLKITCSKSPESNGTFDTHLDVKVKRKVDPKIVSVSEDLLAQSCPLLGDLTNLKFLFLIFYSLK